MNDGRDDLDRRLHDHFAAIATPLPDDVGNRARARIHPRIEVRPSLVLLAATVGVLGLVVAIAGAQPPKPVPTVPITATPMAATEARYRAGQVLRVTGLDLADPYEAYVGDRLYIFEAATDGDEPIYRLEGPSGAGDEDASYEDVPAALIDRSTEPVVDPCPSGLDTVAELLRVRPFERARCLASQEVTIRNVRLDRAYVGTSTLGTRGAGSMTPSSEPERGSLPFSLAAGVEVLGPGWYTLIGRFGEEDETCGSVAGRLRCRERFIVHDVEPGVDLSATLDGAWSRMTDAPISGRSDYVALPIDGRTFVWGGSPEDEATQGAIYDPGTDGWTMIARAPGPDRLRPAAVWTGDEVLIWGGLGGDAGGLRFDPSTGVWAAIREAPIAAGLAFGAWTGNRFLVVNDQAQSAVWDPQTDAWERLPDPPIPVGYIEGAWTGDELIVLGLTDGGNDPIVGAAFSPATGLWRPIAEVPYDGLALGRAPVWTGTEMVLVFHAYDPTGDRWRILEMEGCDMYSGISGVWTGRLIISQVTAYDPVAGRCFTVPATPPRTGYSITEEIRTHEFHTPAWNDGLLMVWSGFTGLDGPGANADGVLFRPDEP